MQNFDICPMLSIAICTRNRAAVLRRVLESAANLRLPADLTWEIVVVDNGSTDGTPSVLAEFATKLPLRSVVEHEPGVANARNTALKSVKGKWICWTDDDVIIDPEWLTAYDAAIKSYPDADYFAGIVTPVLEQPVPEWFADNLPLLSDLVARRDLGPHPRILGDKPDDFPMGANYAVKVDVQKKVPFNPQLGPSPLFRRTGEETAVLRGIKAMGATGYWIPSAKIEHIIPPSRMTPDYVLKFQLAVGETWAVLTDIGGPQFMGQKLDRSGRLFKGAPVWLWRLVATSWVSYCIARITSPPTHWLRKLQRYGYYRGALDYLVRTA